MTEKQINRAIAEACGKVAIYCNDLNAMHAAEESLSEQQRSAHNDNLYDIACNYQVGTGKWRYLSLPARQRAEAFLRTIGKWEE